jgi:hypothetical protein
MDRPIPADYAAERAVLGSCLQEREIILEVRYLVASADFHLEKHAWVYEAILDCLAKKTPPDPITVSHELSSKDRLEPIGGLSFLYDLIDDSPLCWHAEHYARIVARLAHLRRLIIFGGEITASAFDADADPDKLLADVAERLAWQRAAVTNDDWKSQMHDGHDIWHKPYTPRPFVVEGILPVGVTLLHALPKKRKSWLAKNLCYAVAGGGMALGQLQAQQGEAVYLNLEMDEELTIERLRVMFPNEAPPTGVKFFYDWPDLDNGFFTRLDNYVTARPWTRLIVVDTMVRVLPDDAFNKEGYRLDARLIEPFTKFNANRGLAVLLIHHSRKMGGGNDPILASSGSTGLTGSVDSVLELQVDMDDLTKGRLTRSGRRLKDDKPLPLKWDVQLGNWAIDLQAKKLTPERLELLDCLDEHGPLAPNKIAILLDKQAPTIRRLCQLMLKDGQVRNINGLYANPGEDLTA